jgi:hypothetical protein
MSARTPTGFTSFISTVKCSARRPIITTSLDNIINDQQYALTCGQLVCSLDGRPGYLANSPGGGTLASVVIPSLRAKGTSAGTCSLRVYFLVSRSAFITTATLHIGVRANHAASWTYTTNGPMAISATPAWIDFGSDVSFTNQGDLLLGIDATASSSPGILWSAVVFAQPG